MKVRTTWSAHSLKPRYIPADMVKGDPSGVCHHGYRDDS